MDYFDNQMLLRSTYDFRTPRIGLPGTGTQIFNCQFESVIRPEQNQHDADNLLARSFEGNYNFTYPVFLPPGTDRAAGAVIMLHGLNERNWQKYLYWAQYLCEHTGKAVILFPMAFHVNRSPGQWSDPRAMQNISQQRASGISGNTLATPVNAALSTRLDSHPEWFCTSGLQSSYDLISLNKMIRAGEHPLIQGGTPVDFFAYSVGAFLLEVLLIANPDNLFSDSKSFLFLGGSSFEQMQGISKYILDTQAFNRLEEAFILKDPVAIRHRINIDHLNAFNGLWSAFMAMLRLDRHQAQRDKAFSRLRNQISAVGLALDQVIPAKSILRTLCGPGTRNRIPVTILDFPYPYSHENPFPTGNQNLRPQVDTAFSQVFTKASLFLR